MEGLGVASVRIFRSELMNFLVMNTSNVYLGLAVMHLQVLRTCMVEPHVEKCELEVIFVASCVTHVGGDMFKSIPSGDAIFMKVWFLLFAVIFSQMAFLFCGLSDSLWVFTTWTDDECIEILKNCHKALPAGGKLIACEPALPEHSDDSHRTGALLSGDIFVMTIYRTKGKHRTEEEYRQLGVSAGFPHCRSVHIDYFSTILEFIK
ncbi:Nicotinate N-methyltransferase 1-like protein [Drosera capensis]